MRTRRVALFAVPFFVLILLAFVLYLNVLYRQLTNAFAKREQFVPTRIYSDVSRILPPQTRTQIESRLAGLGYAPSRAGTDGLRFTLHAQDYPPYLIPDGHPQLDALSEGRAGVLLQFESAAKDAPLKSLRLNDTEIADLYLEPELMTTLSRAGNLEGKNQIRSVLKLEDIPAPVWQAIIAIEDKSFLDHKGFDPRGLARAFWVNLRTQSLSQGGSTLTQQLVKNLMARRTRNIFRKFNELFLAILLEFTYGKEEILERYLNEVYLGQVGNLEVHGVAEGAQHFFGKRLEDLNLAEIALMAGLIRGPSYYSPYRNRERAIERQRLVLRKMVETGQIAEAEATAALRMPIRLAPAQSVSNKAPYFTDFVKAELIRQLKDRMAENEIIEAGFRVYTTADLALNAAAQDSVASGVTELEKRFKVGAEERLEGSLVSVEHATGFVRALVGGKSYRDSNFNRVLNMRRQVGSTFKPIVYLSALRKGADSGGVTYGPGYPVEDAPWKLSYDRGKQSWSPRNFEKSFMGWTTMRAALAHSVNTVAARLGLEVGLTNIIATARLLGIESELPKVPSLSLGVAELSPIELLRAFATVANGGLQDELTLIRAITHDDGSGFARFVYHPKQVIEPAAAELLSDMMGSVFSEGTAREAGRMGFTLAAAGKTGTTSSHRDAWFAGFARQLTTVVWVGMDVPPPHPEAEEAEKPARIALTGAGAALPIWVNFMKSALRGSPEPASGPGENLVEIRIDRHTGKRATSDCPEPQVLLEKFIRGQEPGAEETCAQEWPASAPEMNWE